MLVPASACPVFRKSKHIYRCTCKTQCCKAGAGLPQTEAMQLSWPLLPGQLELDLGSRPAQTREQGMTSWRTDRHQGCTQSEAPKGQRGRTQGVGCRGKSDHHHPTQLPGGIEGVPPKNPGGETEKPRKISYFLLV